MHIILEVGHPGTALPHTDTDAVAAGGASLQLRACVFRYFTIAIGSQ